MELALVMGFDIFILLLQHFFGNSTNKALTFFIVGNSLGFLLQLTESINQDTAYNIAEEKVHENDI